MTDERLRQLERCWKESGGVDEEATYLLERVRTGRLALADLRLAGYCGHAAAQLALGERLAAIPPDPRPGAQIRHWADGLERWGLNVCVRGALAAIQPTIGEWAAAGLWRAFEDGPLARAPWVRSMAHRAFLTAIRWLRAPEPRATASIHVARERVRDLWATASGLFETTSVAELSVNALDQALQTILEGPKCVGMSVAVAARAQFGEGASIEKSRSQVGAVLIPWALDHCDLLPRCSSCGTDETATGTPRDAAPPDGTTPW